MLNVTRERNATLHWCHWCYRVRKPSFSQFPEDLLRIIHSQYNVSGNLSQLFSLLFHNFIGSLFFGHCFLMMMISQ